VSDSSTILARIDELRFTVIKNCGNCTHANLVLSTCMLYDAQPPMKVVLTGCDNFDLEIPF